MEIDFSETPERITCHVSGIDNLSVAALIQLLRALVQDKHHPRTGGPADQRPAFFGVRTIDQSTALVTSQHFGPLLTDSIATRIAVSRKILQPIINRGARVKDTTAAVTLTLRLATESEIAAISGSPSRKRKREQISDLPLIMERILGERGIEFHKIPISRTYKSIKFDTKENGGSDQTWNRFFLDNPAIDKFSLAHAVYLEISRDERIVVIVPHATPQFPHGGRVDLGKFPADVHLMKLSALQRLLGLPLFVSPPWGVCDTAVQRTVVDAAVLDKPSIIFELGSVALQISGLSLKRLAADLGWEILADLWKPADAVLAR